MKKVKVEVREKRTARREALRRSNVNDEFDARGKKRSRKEMRRDVCA